MTDEHDRDLSELLRQPIERLSPPDGTWEAIDRRARRRKAVRAGLGVAAAVILIAGAVPAVIAVRHDSDNQTLSVGHLSDNPLRDKTGSTTQPSQSPAPASPELAGFFPESLSFVSSDEGYLWGSVGTSRRGVVAKTTDGGQHWAELPSPKVKNSWVANKGAAQIRFANADVGFVYGSRNFITTDAGQHWRTYKTPGYIADLEAMHQRIWALVRHRPDSHAVRLYTATAAHPRLRRVGRVGVMHGNGGAPEVAGAASIALSGNRVDVIVGRSSFYSSPNGRAWKQRTNPCHARVDSGTVQSTLVSSSSATGVVVACGYNVDQSAETKRVFESANSGARWVPVPTDPHPAGTLQTLTAGSPSDILIGTSRGGTQVTHDNGRIWSTIRPNGVELSFVGFIATNHIVAVADRADSETGSFATSYDAGSKWTITSFPG
jgi:photosystem II stability/assembly factor-like uncharacterized protein